MCGIYGWFGEAPNDPHAVEQINSRLLRHRGPDDEGFELGDRWGLGFRRLSILDLSPSGHQPMATRDGRYQLVFNGEIYNYLELRSELEAAGETFVSSSDTEVLLRLLALRGSAALSSLNGMFALAFVDLQEKRFLLARDRMGQKPLYYQVVNGQLRFASELKGLLSWADASREIDPIAFVQYLSLGYFPSDRCVLKGYRKLAQSHYLEGRLSDPGESRVAAYWEIEINREHGDSSVDDHQIDELQELLDDAVRIRLRSDVKVGLFLSGGIDSGLVAAMASGARVERRPLALTVGYNEKGYDETDLARTTANHFGLEHHVVQMEPQNLSDIDTLTWFYDEPFGDASALPSFALCKAASEFATVFLSGDGGDEAFAGYRRYSGVLRHSRVVREFGALRGLMHSTHNLFPTLSRTRYRILKAFAPNSGFAAAYDAYPNDPAIRFLLDDSLKSLAQHAGEPVWQSWGQDGESSLTSRQQRLDYDLYLPDDILVKMDRASMASSIEVRSPLLDYRVAEWAAALPRSALLNTERGKLPLRKLSQRLLPPEIHSGLKKGFSVPLVRWFRRPEGTRFLKKRLMSEEAERRKLWDISAVGELIDRHASGKGRAFEFVLWNLLMFDAWARLYLDSRDFLTPPQSPSTVCTPHAARI